MTNLRTLPAAIAAAIMLGLGQASSANAGDFYIGAGGYWADTDVGDDTVPAGFIGYTFLDTNFLMLSVEAGYYDLGNTSNRNEKIEASAITAGGVVALPLGPFFEIYAKGGVAFTDTKKDFPGFNDDKNDENAYYGAGATVDILDTIDIYVEYLVFDTDFNSEVAGVGIKLTF